MPTAQHTRSLILAVLGGLAALVLLTVTALAFGTADVPWRDCLHFLWAGASGGSVPAVDAANYRIVVESRLPRVLLAVLVGAGLSVVGVIVQAMVRNALADPYVLEISSRRLGGRDRSGCLRRARYPGHLCALIVGVPGRARRYRRRLPDRAHTTGIGTTATGPGRHSGRLRVVRGDHGPGVLGPERRGRPQRHVLAAGQPGRVVLGQGTGGTCRDRDRNLFCAGGLACQLNALPWATR